MICKIMNIEESYNKWQCTDIDDNYIGEIQMVKFTKSDLFSFAEYYHKSKVKENELLHSVMLSFSDYALQGELENRGYVVLKENEHFE